MNMQKIRKVHIQLPKPKSIKSLYEVDFYNICELKVRVDLIKKNLDK